PAALRRAGVKAVALLAGEWGAQIAGERATAARLRAQGFAARFWTMEKAGHYYSANIDALMATALDWVVRQGEGAAALQGVARAGRGLARPPLRRAFSANLHGTLAAYVTARPRAHRPFLTFNNPQGGLQRRNRADIRDREEVSGLALGRRNAFS